jgi:hypothetical protein
MERRPARSPLLRRTRSLTLWLLASFARAHGDAELVADGAGDTTEDGVAVGVGVGVGVGVTLVVGLAVWDGCGEPAVGLGLVGVAVGV